MPDWEATSRKLPDWEGMISWLPGEGIISIWRLTVRRSHRPPQLPQGARQPAIGHRSRRRLGVGGPQSDFAMVPLLNDGDLVQAT